MTTVTHGEYVRHCTDPYEVWRAETMFTKEPGTVAWLSGLKAGETFYDIGANIGIYTDIAARQVGPSGRVYAFEPHVGNAASLMRHVVEAGLTNVTLLTCALSALNEVQPFAYASARAGSSGSQFGHTRDERGVSYEPVFTEIKQAFSLDDLIPTLRLVRPDLVKIDVDGNELSILRGMRSMLRMSGLRSVQVETRRSNRAEVLGHMTEAGYRLDHVHYTSQGAQQIAKGSDPDTLPNNTVFVKA